MNRKYAFAYGTHRPINIIKTHDELDAIHAIAASVAAFYDNLARLALVGEYELKITTSAEGQPSVTFTYDDATAQMVKRMGERCPLPRLEGVITDTILTTLTAQKTKRYDITLVSNCLFLQLVAEVRDIA